MKINKEELISVLEKVKPGLASKEVIENSTSFIFQDGYVFTSNDEISICLPFDIGIDGAVRANELYKLLSKTKDKEIELTLENNEIHITGKKSKAGIKCVTDIDNIVFPGIDLNYTEIPNPKLFLESIELCSHCASKDMSRLVLTCVSIEGDSIVASDSYRIIIATIEGDEAFDEQILIPASAIKFLIKYPVTSFAFDQSWMHFKTEDDLIFSCRLLEAEYEDVSRYFNVKGNELQFPNTMLDMLERAGIFTRENVGSEFVNITVENKKMTVKAEGEFGWIEETANCRYNKEKIEFMIEPFFLEDILKSLNKCIVSDSVLLFEGDNYKHIIALGS